MQLKLSLCTVQVQQEPLHCHAAELASYTVQDFIWNNQLHHENAAMLLCKGKLRQDLLSIHLTAGQLDCRLTVYKAVWLVMQIVPTLLTSSR